jgi:hypothetical protein
VGIAGSSPSGEPRFRKAGKGSGRVTLVQKDRDPCCVHARGFDPFLSEDFFSPSAALSGDWLSALNLAFWRRSMDSVWKTNSDTGRYTGIGIPVSVALAFFTIAGASTPNKRVRDSPQYVS